MLINPFEYKEMLTELWAEAFGEDYDYIDLLFDPSAEAPECFAELSSDRIVSALYLLKGEILLEGRLFRGRYLYAAATFESHRSKGYMAKLIREALAYCRNESLDFICLVPADEGLYDYYSRFGFREGLYKYSCFLRRFDDNITFARLTRDEFYNKRLAFEGNHFRFTSEQFAYAYNALRYYNAEFLHIGESLSLIKDDDGEIIELISRGETLSEDEKRLLNCLGAATAFSPYDLELLGESEKIRFGMICPVSDVFDELSEKAEIYMNIALD